MPNIDKILEAAENIENALVLIRQDADTLSEGGRSATCLPGHARRIAEDANEIVGAYNERSAEQKLEAIRLMTTYGGLSHAEETLENIRELIDA